MEIATGKCLAHKDPQLPKAPSVSEDADWIAALSAIGAADALTLEAAARTFCPHDGLPARVYRRVVVHFDRLAAASPLALATISQFCAALNDAWPVAFADRAESYRVAALKKLEGGTAFTFVQRGTVRFLYDDVEVWAAFGYEGAAVHLGGYVTRGFDDLDWLPPVPEFA